jgi:hypothetical protein
MLLVKEQELKKNIATREFSVIKHTYVSHYRQVTLQHQQKIYELEKAIQLVEESKNIERVVIKKRKKKWGKTGNRVRGQSMEASRGEGSEFIMGSEESMNVSKMSEQ